MPPSSPNAHKVILNEIWGYPSFRPGQEEIVKAVMGGRDALAILPTGGGKSICYQVPALAGEGLTLVISPLIALMHDQVAALRSRGVEAASITSDLGRREIEQRWQDAEFGRYRLLYISPERLESELFKARAERLPVRLLAVDEAHCISEWGPDFRPAYRRIAEAAERLGRPTVIAVTATATPEVRRDIREQLGLREPLEVVAGFDRPNILPSVFVTSAKLEKATEILNAVPGSAIVYTMSRRRAEDWARRLQAAGVSSTAYHAGMSAADRMEAQQRWLDDSARVVVATSAFGMGIDKPDVRAVIHVDLPPSLEAYYQEAGRAGRDGKRSFSVLLFAQSDAVDALSFAQDAHPTSEVVQQVYETVLSVAQLAIGSESDVPIVVDVLRIGGMLELSPLAVRAAVEALVRQGAWAEIPSGEHRALLRMRVSAEQLRRVGQGGSSADLPRFVDHLLRATPTASFHDWIDIDFRDLERATGLSRKRLLRGLDFLAQREMLSYQPPGEGLRIRLIGPRSERAPVDHKALRESRRRAEHRLGHVLRYARSIACRRWSILTYFGEHAADHCGGCDNCLGRHQPPTPTPADEPRLQAILKSIHNGEEQSTWLPDENLPPHRMMGLVDWLVHEGFLEIKDPLAGTFDLTGKGSKMLARG